jgi:hypothetical protein
MKYGIWIEQPGVWKGWFGFASGDGWKSGFFVPMTFDEQEAIERVAACKARNAYPGATVIEARPSPPESLHWDESEWRKHKGIE